MHQSRSEAKRLLAEAGYPKGLDVELHNRGVDQPWKIVGTWLADQLRRVGIRVKQRVQSSGPFFASLRRKKDWAITMDANCGSVVNPLLDVSKFISDDISSDNWASYIDRQMDDMFDQMNRAPDLAEQRRIMRRFEKRGLDEQAHMFVTFWWFRIIPHRSIVKDWKIAPSHYLNQSLDQVWLDQ